MKKKIKDIFDTKGTIEYLWSDLPEKYHLDETDTFLLRRTIHIGLRLMEKILALGLVEEFNEEFKEECEDLAGMLGDVE